MTVTQQAYYCLSKLIVEKYGYAKYAIGCEIVARWVTHDTKENWTLEKVLSMCSTEQGLPLTPAEAEALRRLFGLKSIMDIYTVNTDV